jgi:phenylacetate-CoA ligase
MYLENWLHTIVRHNLATNAGYCPDRITRSEVEAYQLFKLRRVLKYAHERSTFYRELFDKNGIKPDHIQTIQDLSRIPCTEQHDLAKKPYRFLCTSQSEIARPYAFVTSGTTGPQKKVFWTQPDLDRITGFMAAGMGTVAEKSDVILIFLPDGRPNSQADLLFQGVKKLGATPVIADPAQSTEEHWRKIKECQGSILFGYASRLIRFSKELQQNCDPGTIGVKTLFLAGEYLPVSIRRDLEKIWNCRLRTHYGLTEMGLGVAVECDAMHGYHFNEADLLLEIIDPGTGDTVEEGNEGELVFTTLSCEAMPLIRYRTHDLSRFLDKPCRCGAASLLRFDWVKKRIESTVVFDNGGELYPSLLDDTLFEISGLMDYQATLSSHKYTECLNIKVEPVTGGLNLIPEVTERLHSIPLIAERIASGKMAEPEVELLPCGALKSGSRAKKMIVDRR